MDVHDLPGWAIYKGNSRYIPISFETEGAAKKELAALLRPYPPGHEWREKLRVDVWPLPAKPAAVFDPPYGYVRDKNRHGSFLRPYPYEERVLREISKMESTHPNEVASRLNELGFHTRERKKFTNDYIRKIRENRSS